MVITFSNIKGSAGGGGATGGTVSGITLWSDETTKAYIDNALSGVTDVLSAYTKTEDFATINGSAITSGGNLIIEATPYTAGTNIDITDHVISVTGITIPTKVSELANDSGYITTADTQNFVTSGDVQTQINDSISGKADSSAVTAQISEVKAQIEAEIPSKVSDLQNDLNFASTGEVESMISGFTTSADVKTQIEDYNYINSGQAQTQIDSSISGKLDTDIFTAYTANTKTELDNKQDASGMTEYATTAFTENTYAKIGDIPTKTSDLTNDSGFITDAALSGYATEQYVDNSVSGKVDNSALTQYYTSAQTDTAIQNATNGLASEEWVESQGYLKEHQSLSAYSTTEQMNQAIGSATAATTGWVESQGYLTEHQDISGKLDTNVFTAYTANTQTELNNKQDASGMTAYATTAFTESTYLKEHQSLSAYSTTEQVQTLINTAKQEVENEIPDVSDFVTSAQVETQITDKGYITGYTESDPVFMASPASGISTQDITNWNNKLDSSDLEPYYTSAQTDTAISNATSGKQDTLVSGTNIKTINNQSLLGSGNIEIQGGGSGSDYSAGANIDITDNVISVTGITVPTKTSDLTNDSGFINSEQAQTQIGSSVSGKVDTDVFTAYTANTKTEIDNAVSVKADSSRVDEIEEVTASALVELHSTKQDILVSGTNIKTINNQSLLGSGNIEIQGGSGGGSYTAGNNIDITNDVISVTGLATINGSAITEGGNIVIQGGSGGGSNIIEITQAEYDALTAYTEDAIYVITDSQAINMDNYVTTGALGSYYTSAQTDTAISNAVSGKTDRISVTASSSGYKFPTWNNQGCITGTYSSAYQASQTINGSSRTLYSNSSSSLPTIYAPTSAGSAGQPLLSNGSGAPVWGAYKFQFISQSEYDALATKDSTTIYFIVNEN